MIKKHIIKFKTLNNNGKHQTHFMTIETGDINQRLAEMNQCPIYQYELMIPSAGSTSGSQQPVAHSHTPQGLTATTPRADSTPNNISNNIKESTSSRTKKTSKLTRIPLPEDFETNGSHKEMAVEYGLNLEALTDGYALKNPH